MEGRHANSLYCSYSCSYAFEKQRPKLPSTDYTEALRRDPCSYCGRMVKSMALDHIEALTSGGSNDEMNLTPACKSCNSAKKNTPLLHFMLRHVAV